MGPLYTKGQFEEDDNLKNEKMAIAPLLGYASAEHVELDALLSRFPVDDEIQNNCASLGASSGKR